MCLNPSQSYVEQMNFLIVVSALLSVGFPFSLAPVVFATAESQSDWTPEVTIFKR